MPHNKQPEVWLRGALPGFSALVQPVAHALLQAKEVTVQVLRNNIRAGL